MGGKAILFSILDNNRAQIGVYLLASGERKIVLENIAEGTAAPFPPSVYYVPTGHLLYFYGGTLFAVPFDVRLLRVTGNPVPVIQGIQQSASFEPMISISDSGSLIYIPGPVSTSTQVGLGLADRNGAVESLKLPPRAYQTPRASIAGRQARGIYDR
jgi:hypothetical protein